MAPCRIFCLGCLPYVQSSPEVTHCAVGARLIGWRPVLAKSPLRRRASAGFHKGGGATQWHPPSSCTLLERPLLVRDCLFVGRFPLTSQLASISRGHSTIRHPWTRWVAVAALPLSYILKDHSAI